MPAMTDEERDAFLLEVRLGHLGIGRSGRGPLMAPIWYVYTPGGTIDINMGETSAKAKRLRAEGRATMLVADGSGGRYRYVSVEGPVSVTPLGDDTEDAIRVMATRYLGAGGGDGYTAAFMRRLADDSFPDGHGPTEVVVRITPSLWRTEVLP